MMGTHKMMGCALLVKTRDVVDTVGALCCGRTQCCRAAPLRKEISCRFTLQSSASIGDGSDGSMLCMPGCWAQLVRCPTAGQLKFDARRRGSPPCALDVLTAPCRLLPPCLPTSGAAIGCQLVVSDADNPCVRETGYLLHLLRKAKSRTLEGLVDVLRQRMVAAPESEWLQAGCSWGL